MAWLGMDTLPIDELAELIKTVEWEGGRMDQDRVRCREGAWAQLPNAIQNTFDSYSIPIGWRQLKP